MQQPILVVMAAGMGSRYGGLKQVDPIGPNGQAIMDYSLYDAKRAGFERAVFVISPAMEAEYPEALEARLGAHMQVRCAVQRPDDLPPGYAMPPGRSKPWGTGHAVRAARALIDAPFAVINADDYYGISAYESIYTFLRSVKGLRGEYAMVGYRLSNALSSRGYVSRGICQTDADGFLTTIVERTHIIATTDGPLYTEDGERYYRLSDDAIASMNIWGFTPDILEGLDRGFASFLAHEVPENPLKAEYYLPGVVDMMLHEKAARVRVLPTDERWYGVTYREDRPEVEEAIRKMTREGRYPEKLW